ncbi:glutathione S-transferase, putative, partial [Rhizoctonia solani AG-3 Rhs1AP]
MSTSNGVVRNPNTSNQRATPLPFCARCIQQGTTDKCRYDPVKKSKLTILKEENALLKERLAQLERAKSSPEPTPPALEGDTKDPPSSAFSQVSLEDDDYEQGYEQDEEANGDARGDPINIESLGSIIIPGPLPKASSMCRRRITFKVLLNSTSISKLHTNQSTKALSIRQASTSHTFHPTEFAQAGSHIHSTSYAPQVQTGHLPEVHTWPPTPTDPVPPSATTSGFTPSPQSNRWRPSLYTSPEITHGSPSGPYTPTNYPQGAMFRDDGRYVGGAMPSFNAYQGAPIQAPQARRRPVPSPPVLGHDMLDRYFQEWRKAQPQSQAYIENQYAQIPTDNWALVGNWWEKDDLPVDVRNYLIELFLPYRKQVGLEIWIPGFLASLHLPPERRPHPGFMWMIYSFAAYFSVEPELSARLPAFLKRARQVLEESFANGDRLFDYIRGQTLYASLKYMSGKTNEGAMAVASACHAAIVCGLHKITSAEVAQQTQYRERSRYRIKQIEFQLEPATSPREHGERITAFWQLLLVDYSAAATTGSLAMFREDGDERSRVETVFPRPLEEYESGQASQAPYATLGDIFTSKTIPSPPDTVLTMQVKATTLLERAVRLATKWGRGEHISTTDPSKYHVEYYNVLQAIQHFKAYLPGLRPQEGNPAESQLFLTSNGLVFERLFPYFMIWNADIQLHSMFDHEEAHQMALTSAREIRYLTSLLTDTEVEQLGVLLGELNIILHAQEVLTANHLLASKYFGSASLEQCIDY